MGNKLDLTGFRSGRLVAIEPTEQRATDGGVIWRCRCDCGKEHNVKAAFIKERKVLSCGCLPRDLCREIGRDGKRREVHGGSQTRLYRTWANMKHRCYYEKHESYPEYGGRGITVCAEWLHDFKAFQEWALSHGYRDDLTIDRIDNDKGYSPDNCRWATITEQAINKRPFKRKPHPEHYPKYKICGVSKTSAEWAKEAGIKQATFLNRWERGKRGTELIKPLLRPPTHSSKKKPSPDSLDSMTGERR